MANTRDSDTGITPDEIRAIREGLNLTQEQAGELLGGGPRAFTKYEAGNVRPAASVAHLLRLLDANPNALKAVRNGGTVIAPVAPVLPSEVTGQHISALTAHTFPALLRRLLSAEAQAHGLPEDRIHVASNITTADGGEDGRISWTEGPPKTTFVPSRLSQFQLKTGKIAPSEAAREVSTKKGTIKPMICDVLQRDGNYVLLCSWSYTNQQIKARKDSICKMLRETGMDIDDEQVDFRDADQIASWANSFPSVAVWVKELTQPGTLGPFRSWNDWADRSEHHTSRWTEDERLPDLRELIQERVASPHPYRACGGPLWCRQVSPRARGSQAVRR